MADYSDLDPTALRASLSDGTRLKKSITTDLYTGGTPSAANQVKPSIMYADGTLKESITYADGTLKPSWLIAGSGGGVDTTLFITEWTVAGADTLTMPTTGTGYNGTVTWKDSLGATVSTGAFTDGDMTPLQAIAVDGVNSPYTCEVSGDFPRVYFNNGGDSTLITEVKQWGNIAWGDMTRAFFGCTNMDVTATDTPDLSSCLTLSFMFWSCPTLTGGGNWAWNTSNITTMVSTFQTASLFNGDISSWDVSSVTSMNSMLQSAEAFAQDISGWTTTSLTSLTATLRGATSFNYNISGWDTSGVTSMAQLFLSATSYDQDLGALDITGLTGTGMSLFLSGVTMSTANYDATLNGFKAQVEANSDLPASISFHGGNSVYSTAGQAAHNYLTGTASWTITDGGLA